MAAVPPVVFFHLDDLGVVDAVDDRRVQSKTSGAFRT